MAGKKDRQMWQCDACGNKNVLNAAAYQSISCPACDTRYAIVRVEGDKAVLPYHQQERGQNSVE